MIRVIPAGKTDVRIGYYYQYMPTHQPSTIDLRLGPTIYLLLCFYNSFEAFPWLSMKGQLAKEQSRAEALSAEVMKLSAELKHSIQAYNSLTRL